jgi:hypothetical protein
MPRIEITPDIVIEEHELAFSFTRADRPEGRTSKALPRRRIKGVDVTPGPRRVHGAVDHDRRRFLAARRP